MPTNKPFFTAHTIKMPEGDWQLLISVRGLLTEEMALAAFEALMLVDQAEQTNQDADSQSDVSVPSRYVH